MRLTFVLPEWPWRAVGGYKVVYRYATELQQRGHRVTLIHSRNSRFASSTSSTFSDPIPMRIRHTLESLRKPQPQRIYPIHDQIEVVMHNVIQPSHIPDGDVVIATSCHSAPFVADLPASTGAKKYFIQHWEDWSADPAFVRDTWKLNLDKIVISRWLLDIAQTLGESAVYVPNAIDTSEFPEGPAIADRPLQITALASDHPWKRTDLLCDVLNLVKARRPHVTAAIFGTCSRPAGLPEWAQYIKSPDAETLVKTIYQRSRIYLCASDGEGWHLPPAEAMSAGAAVVSTRIDGVTEYAADVAHFADVGDAAQLTDAVITLIDDEVECQKAATAGARVMRAYTPRDAIDGFEAALLSNTR